MLVLSYPSCQSQKALTIPLKQTDYAVFRAEKHVRQLPTPNPWSIETSLLLSTLLDDRTRQRTSAPRNLAHPIEILDFSALSPLYLGLSLQAVQARMKRRASIIPIVVPLAFTWVRVLHLDSRDF